MKKIIPIMALIVLSMSGIIGIGIAQEPVATTGTGITLEKSEVQINHSVYDCLRIENNFTGSVKEYIKEYAVNLSGNKFDKVDEIEIHDYADVTEYGPRICWTLKGTKTTTQVNYSKTDTDENQEYDFKTNKWSSAKSIQIEK